METALETVLRDLPARGTRLKDRGYRQVWRFEAGGKAYYLKFYPRRGWRRWLGINPAMREMRRLQWLQKAEVPAPRAVGTLMGFMLDGAKGDALLIEGLEPSESLESALVAADLRGESAPEHRDWLGQVIDLVATMARAGLGHDDLHLGNLLVCGGRVHVIDGYAVRRGGMRLSQLLLLEHSAREWLTRADRVRAWQAIGPDRAMPRVNPVSLAQWRKFVARSGGNNRYFGRFSHDGLSGVFIRRHPRARRWSVLSRCELDDTQLSGIWVDLEMRRRADQLERRGDGWAGEIAVGGVPVNVLYDRRADARWVWTNAWRMIARGIPTAWPLAMADRSVLGWKRAGAIVREAVEGPSLAEVDLNAMDASDRWRLFHRVGRIVRGIDTTNLYHRNLSGESFVVVMDEKLGPMPMLVDVAPIRRRRHVQWSLPALLAAMKRHPGYSQADSLALCRGYAPGAPLAREEAP